MLGARKKAAGLKPTAFYVSHSPPTEVDQTAIAPARRRRAPPTPSAAKAPPISNKVPGSGTWVTFTLVRPANVSE